MSACRIQSKSVVSKFADLVNNANWSNTRHKNVHDMRLGREI